MPVPLFTKTRIAPTPSGYLHLGNVLSFAITATLARKHRSKILLRIDDIDQARANQQYVQDIFDTLNFLNILWHDGPKDINDFEANYSQLNRMAYYNDSLKFLHDKNFVFACTCSRKQVENCNCPGKHIPLDTPDASWRLKTTDKEIEIKNYNGQMLKATLPIQMQNFIVRKKDGYPAYQLTSVIDDLLFGVDLIVRGEDLFLSTLTQHELATALDLGEKFGSIAFYHHPLITDAAGQKLSKSAGATSIKYLRERGKSAADVYGMIAGILGIETDVTNWQQLGDAALMKS